MGPPWMRAGKRGDSAHATEGRTVFSNVLPSTRFLNDRTSCLKGEISLNQPFSALETRAKLP